jgi:hypothetical protein
MIGNKFVKTPLFFTFLLITFLGKIFCYFFMNSAKKSMKSIEFKKLPFFGLFRNFEDKCAKKGSKKEKLFLKTCLTVDPT